MLRISLGFIVLLFSLNSMGMGHWNPDWQDIPNFDPAAESHFIKRPDGSIIHYTTMGEGTPVFMIHGYYATGDVNWYNNGIAQELAKTNKVIAMDMRGHGKSSKHRRKKYYGENMWRDAVAVLDNEKADKVHVHAYSMGGVILNQILYYYPERVISAIHGGSGIFEYDKEEQKKIIKDIEPTAEIKQEEKAAETVVLKLTDPDHIALQALSRNHPDKGEAKKLDLTKIDIPVFAINGEYDYPNVRTHRMERELKNFKSMILPGKGHLTAITPGFMPKEYLIETVKFIREADKEFLKNQ